MTAETVPELAWVVIALPLAGALVLIVAGRRLGGGAGWLATAAMALSFAAALAVLAALAGRDPGERQVVVELFTWIRSGSLNIGATPAGGPAGRPRCWRS